MIDEAVLDDPAALAAHDPQEVLRAVAGAGAQVRAATTYAGEAGLGRLRGDGRPRALVVVTAGGAAAPADLLRAVVGSACPVPVVGLREGALPGWVGTLDVVLAVSASGHNPATVAAASEAARRGARLVTVGPVTGPLADLVRRGALHVRADTEGRPSRWSLWALAVPLLVAADALGLAAVPPEALLVAADLLDGCAAACRPSAEAFVNPAKSLALSLDTALPLLVGDGPAGGAAARRFAVQLAATARQPALAGELPDDGPVLAATFSGPYGGGPPDALFADPETARPQVRLLLLRAGDGAAEAAAARATVEVAEAAGVRVHELAADGVHPVERLASLVGLTDFASVYLALGRGYDPATSPSVVDLKERLPR
ncbi:MAG: SIS domain-containing protein [Actinomycetota bacterium]